MIGKLSGIIDSIYDDYLILDVNGVGYRIFCSSKILACDINIGSKASFYIETIVREDSITLFGFKNLREKECFNTLCKVSGIGSKVALKIMGVAEIDEIISGIVNSDKNIFCRASGVGSKVALRIITELQNSSFIKGYENMKFVNSLESNIISENKDNNKQIILDAISALEGLGYQKNYVRNIVVSITTEKPYLTLESVVTESLKKINNF